MVSRAQDIEAVYETALDGFERAIGVERASVMLFEPDGVLRFKAWRRLSDRYRVSVEGHSPWTPDTREPQPIAVSDAREDASLRDILPTIDAEGIRSLAFIPLCFESRLLGQLMLYFGEPHTFTTTEIQLAQTIASHVAFAIEQRRIAKALRDSEQRFRRVVESAQDGVAMLDAEYRITYANERMSSMLGYRSGELKGMSAAMIVPPEEQDRGVAALNQRIRDAAESIDLKLRCKDGSFIWAIVSVTPTHDTYGAFTGAVAMVTDITQRRKSEEMQRFLIEATGVLSNSLEYEETLQGLADLLVPRFADIASMSVIRDGGILRVATRARTPGHEQLVAKVSLRDWLAPVEGMQTVGQVVASGESVFAPDISESWLRLAAPNEAELATALEIGARSLIVVPVASREEFLGAMVLVTASDGRVYDEIDLHTAQELARRAAIALDNAMLYERARVVANQLKLANEAKDEFIGMMSHELRTPTTTIFGGVRLLRSRSQHLTDEDREALFADIEIESERLGRMIEDLLLLSRLDVGKTVPTEPLLLERVLEQVSRTFEARNPGRSLRVTNVTPNLAAGAEPVYLDQVLRNVLANAVKYSPDGSAIEITTEKQGDEALILVMDRGVGVPDEDLEKIFERFYRREETSKFQRGAGLGLTVCRRLMEAQSGRIWAAQRPGGGLIIGLALKAIDLDSAD